MVRKTIKKNQAALIGELVREFDIKVQSGGGIRSREQIKALLDKGITRVIIGSQAVHEPNKVSEWFSFFGTERLVLAFDVKIDGENKARVATHGWQQLSERTINELIAYYQHVGLTHVLCTDIDRDGTLTSPNIGLYQMLVKTFPIIQFQASGGISSLVDLQTLRKCKLNGAIVGKSLYENKFTLREALSC